MKVACKVLNGLLIQAWKPGYDDGTGDGVKSVIKDGPAVRLNGPSSLHAGAGNSSGAGLEPGITEVDGEWFAAWLEQNKLNPFVAEGLIYAIEEPADPNGK